jgi:hypothetical protein
VDIKLLIGLAPVKALALADTVAMGMGTGTFTCNLGPVLMGTAPRSHLARIQALLGLPRAAPPDTGQIPHCGTHGLPVQLLCPRWARQGTPSLGKGRQNLEPTCARRLSRGTHR